MDSLLVISSNGNLSLPPPSSFSRLPPDGHEFPPNYQETGPTNAAFDSCNAMKFIVPHPTPPIYAEVAPVKKTYFHNEQKNVIAVANGKKCNSSNCEPLKTKMASWRNDEKSEKSVRDKIAMFSNSQNQQPVSPDASVFGSKKLNRFKSSENVYSQNDTSDYSFGGSPSAKSLSKSYMNVNKLGTNYDRSSTEPFSKNASRRSSDFCTSSVHPSGFILDSKIDTAATRNPGDIFSSSSAYSSCSPDSSLSPTSSPMYLIGSSCTLPRKMNESKPAVNQNFDPPATILSRTTSFSSGIRPHNRSRSLVDVGNLQNRYPSEKSLFNTDADRQASWNSLIEQRRRSMSKLRGLVIPEKVSEITNLNQTILDLPEIKTEIKINCYSDDDHNPHNVKYPLKNRFNSLSNQNENFKRLSNNFNKPKNIINMYSSKTNDRETSSRPWKSHTPTKEIPKYSPAFKRKSLTVCSKPSSVPVITSSFPDRNQGKAYTNNSIGKSSPPMSLEKSKTPRSDSRPYSNFNGNVSENISKFDKITPSYTNYEYSNETKKTPIETKRNGYLISASLSHSNDGVTRSKLDFNATRDRAEDSDNDSAVSSSRSSISPPISPMSERNYHHINEDETSSHLLSVSPIITDRKPLHRTLSSDTTASGASSTTSTLTSGSQASCSSNGVSSGNDAKSKRVLKPQSVEAINRKNVLTSAKYSCGLDAKLGSPLIQRKFVVDSSKEQEISDKTSHTNEGSADDLASDLEFLNYLEKTLCSKPNKEPRREQICNEPEMVYHQVSTDGSNPNVQIAYIEVNETPIPNCPNESGFESEHSCSQNNSLLSDSQNSSLLPESQVANDQVDYNGNCDLKDSYLDAKTGNHFGDSTNDSACPLITKLSKEFDVPLISDDFSDSDRNENLKSNSEVVKSNGYCEDDLIHRSDMPSNDESKGSFAVQDKKEPLNKVLTSNFRSVNSHRSVSVNDIRKAFEKSDPVAPVSGRNSLTKIVNHVRVSSLDSTASDDSLLPPYGSSSNLYREQFGSISSLASSTSLISQQELQQLIEDANQTAEEAGGEGTGHEVAVIVLHRDVPGASIGITLAGGADYETKEITVHKVLAGSPADRDGRIQKGDRILSINGRSMKDATHREALSILKAPRFEVVLVVSHWRLKNGDAPIPESDPILRTNFHQSRSSRKPIEELLEHKTPDPEPHKYDPPVTITLVKDGAGLGFSLEGGKDSPFGDQPLTIKKIFSGGCAEKCGQLSIGDELLKVNGTDVTSMTRIEAWSLMKKLENGNVTLTLRRISDSKP